MSHLNTFFCFSQHEFLDSRMLDRSRDEKSQKSW